MFGQICTIDVQSAGQKKNAAPAMGKADAAQGRLDQEDPGGVAGKLELELIADDERRTVVVHLDGR